jgi:hypothetical protein
LQILNKQKRFTSIKTQRIYQEVHLLENILNTNYKLYNSMLQNLNNFVPSLDETNWLAHLIFPEDTAATEVTLESKLRQCRKKWLTFGVTNEVDDDDDDDDMSPNLVT